MTLQLLLDGEPIAADAEEALAEEGEEAEEDESTTNPVLPVGNEIVWAAIFFASLWALMKYVLLPPILSMRAEREAKIQADGDAAERATDAVADVRSDYEAALASARAEATALIDEVRAEAEEHKAGLQAAADDEIAEWRREAQAEIDATRAGALESMRDDVSDLAVLAASSVVQRDIDRSTAQGAIDQALEQE